MTNEQDYLNGKQAMAAAVLQAILPELGGEARTAHAWRLERSDVVRALREFGGDWDDDLHLGDVLEKYILPDVDLLREKLERAENLLRELQSDAPPALAKRIGEVLSE